MNTYIIDITGDSVHSTYEVDARDEQFAIERAKARFIEKQQARGYKPLINSLTVEKVEV